MFSWIFSIVITVILIYGSDNHILSSFPLSEQNDGCSPGMCRCTAKKASCVGLNLEYIPAFPDTIISVDFDDNNLQVIDERTFANLTKLPLSRLLLRGNKITTIKPAGIKSLRSNHLMSLALSNNRLKTFNFSLLQPFTQLQRLELSDNELTHLHIDHLPNLNFLQLASNLLRYLPNFCNNNSSFFPNLETLKIQNNTIDRFIPNHVSCLKKLKMFDLSINALSTIAENSFQSLPALERLSIEKQKNPKSYLYLEKSAFNNGNLQNLNLYGNTLKDKHLHPNAFQGCRNLTVLTLAENRFTETVHLNQALSDLVNLEVLLIHGSDLAYFPPVISETLHSLHSIDVRLSHITTWQKDFFKRNTKLHTLKLRNNLIQTVTEDMFPDYLRKQLKNITIGQNPLRCDCESVWFIYWIHSEKRKFSDYPQDYNCLNISEKVCMQDKPIYISVTVVTCVVVSCILLVSLIYKYRWSIKYHIYMWRYRPLKVMNIAEKHFVYDLFVSYCASDSDWVLDSLVPVFEGREGMKLCVHERDFEGGRLIIDNIIHYMENSRKCLIVLSNDFAKSEWCQYEMSLAQKLVMDMCIHSLVVVMLESIEAENMSRSLHALLTTNTYIAWQQTEEQHDDEILWRRLTNSLMH